MFHNDFSDYVPMGMLYHRGAAAAEEHQGDRVGELLRHMPAITAPGEHAHRHVSMLAESQAIGSIGSTHHICR